MPLGTYGLFGPPALQPREMVMSFGYLSMASRDGWSKEDEEFSAAHTATMVPLFAQGRGAEFLSSVRDNADLGRTIRAAILASNPGLDLDPSERAALTTSRDVFTARAPTNVVLLIGDGMGASTLSAGYYALGGLAITRMPETGLVATHAYDRLVNDSAASATALASGHLARYGSVGVAPDDDGQNVPVSSVLEEAERRGLSTGLVTTTTVTHATPAAFYAHTPGRRDEAAIAAFLADLPARVPGSDGLDVVIGGGHAHVDEATRQALTDQGLSVSQTWRDLAPSERALFLLSEEQLPTASARREPGASAPTLAAMTRQALGALSANEKGFFLMVEGGQIDWALHAMDSGQAVIDEVRDFDEAVAQVMAFARERGDTLVIVTADHDHTVSVVDNHYGLAFGQCAIDSRCGGPLTIQSVPIPDGIADRGEGLYMADLQGDWGRPEIALQYAWPIQAARDKSLSAAHEGGARPMAGSHAAHFVPLFAYGPGAAVLRGFHEQPSIGRTLRSWGQSGSIAPQK